jgi:hypothetical protein
MSRRCERTFAIKPNITNINRFKMSFANGCGATRSNGMNVSFGINRRDTHERPFQGRTKSPIDLPRPAAWADRNGPSGRRRKRDPPRRNTLHVSRRRRFPGLRPGLTETALQAEDASEIQLRSIMDVHFIPNQTLSPKCNLARFRALVQPVLHVQTLEHELHHTRN